MPIVAIPLILVALVLLVVWFAAYQLHITALNGIAHFGGTVGALVLRAFVAGIEWAIRAAENEIKDGVKYLESLFSIPIHWLQSHFDQLWSGIYAAYNAIWRLGSVVLPHMIGQALATARGWVDQAEAYTTSQIHQLASWVSGQFTAVYHYVNAEISLAEGYTLSLVKAEETYIAQGLAADARYAQGLYETAIGYTDAQVKALEGWVTGEVGTVTAWAGHEITSLQQWISSIQVSTLAYITALVGPIALDIAKIDPECAGSLCENLSGLSNLVKDLAGAAGIAALIAFAAEAAADPVGTADTVDVVLGPVARAAASGYSALVGVL